MKNRSIQLLRNIETAINNQTLKDDMINPQDIIDCTLQELVVNRMIIPHMKYNDIINRYSTIASAIVNSVPRNIKALTELSLLTLNLIPDSIYYYTSEEWWKNKLGEKYSDEYELIRKNISQSDSIEVFNYPFTKDYSEDDIEVLYDGNSKHHYVMYKGKRMYFPKSHSPEYIKKYCRGIYMEQDPSSPHCYKNEKYLVKEGDIVVDAGVAEGNFALDNIDIASHIYLIEADSDWAETLKLTFKDYADKITLIPAFLDDHTFENHICIDDLNIPFVNFIKMDVEGFERNSLTGAISTIKRSSDLRMAICSYHNDGDEEWIRNFMTDYNFSTEVSSGYMFIEWLPGALVDVIFRRGLVFGRKKA